MTEPNAAAAAPQPAAKKKKKKRSWRLRLLWTGTTLLLLGVLLRIVLPLSLPMVLRKIAGIYDMTCTYSRLELNLFSGDAGIWDLEFKPKEGGTPIFVADYCHGNVSVLNLFRGRLNVWRVEADGVDINLDRNADRHIPLLDRFITASNKGQTAPVTITPATNPTTAKPGEIDLSSPLRVDALRLSHIRVHIHDKGITPELDTELAMDLRLSDLGSPDQPARFEMNLSADPLLDSLKITGQGRSGGKTLDADLHVLVRGIRLKPAAAYLSPLGIKPIGDGITLRADGSFHTAAAANHAQGFTGSIAFDNLSATVDRQEAMALDHLRIDADVIDTKSIRLKAIDFDGARATGSRAADGNLQLLGMEYDPSLVAKPTTQPVEPPASPASPPPALLVELMHEYISLGEIALRHGRIDLHDDAVSPPANISFLADEFAAKDIVHDPQNPNTKVAITGLFHAPGLIQKITVDGSALPFADKKTLNATLQATGIKLDAIKPYLDQIGVESTLKNAQFTAAVQASAQIGETLTASAKVTQFDFRDDQPLLVINGIDLTDANVNPKTGEIHIASIEGTGPGVSIARDAAGQFSTLGFRTIPKIPHPPQAGSKVPRRAGSDAKPPAQPTTAPAFTLASLPKITLDKFSWNGVRLDLEDQSVTPASKISFPDIGVEASHLTTDLAAKKTGDFKAWLSSPQVVGRLEADGKLVSTGNSFIVETDVTGSGLNATPLAPYLKPLNIEPTLHNGALVLHSTAELATTDGPLRGSFGINHLVYTDGPNVLASMEGLRVAAELDQGNIRLREIAIQKPHGSARRNADGTFESGGFRLIPPSPSQSPQAQAVQTPAAAPPQPASPAAPSALPVVLLDNLKVVDSEIDWIDQAVQPTAKITARSSVEIKGLTLGRDAEEADVQILAQVDGAADRVAVTGKLLTGLKQQGIHLTVDASGLRAGPLAAYFPPGIACGLVNGRFTNSIDAQLTPNAAGGIGISFSSGPLDFRDGGDGSPLFHMESARVDVPRIDLPDNALEVKEISVAGIETHAEKLKNGELACMGVLLGVKSDAPIATTRVSVPEPKTLAAEAASPVGVVIPTTGPSVAELMASAHKALPLVTVDKLDLNVDKITLTDFSRPEASPLIVSDLRLHNVNRIDWLGKGYASKPPSHVQFECKVSPLIDRVLVDAFVSPFAQQPNLQVDFSATGVHGKGLTDLVPELKPRVDGSGMEAGTINAHFETEATLDRHSPLDFDISRGFDLSFLLNKVAWRARPDGPVLVGVDEVRSDKIRIDPSAQLVHVKTLEITKPIGFFTREVDGIHALGWTYKIATTQPAATQPTVVVKTEPTAPPQAAANQQPAVVPTGEVRIDKLLISGLDLRVEDNSVSPPLIIPLNGLDVEVRNISTLAPYEDKPIRFSAIVNADKVKLARRGSTPVVLEDRDLFSQITSSGEISLYPRRLHGWAKTSVNGFDLASLQGEAKAFHEDLTNGLYDMQVDLRFDPNGSVAINSRYILTDLRLSEPADGLVLRWLNLPPPFNKTPLDQAIGAIQGADGSIALPINVQSDPAHLSYTDLSLAGASGVSKVIVTALAAAPLKAANDVGGLIGLGGEKKTEDLTSTISFAPGSSQLGPTQSAILAALLQKLLDDSNLTVTFKHQMGAGDVRISAARANPSREESTALESQLRSRKAQLLQLRAKTAGQARAQLVAVGVDGASDILQQLRAIDRELAATEESLDQMGDLLKPGAEKQADRRTRATALQVAGDRLKDLTTQLQLAGIAADRINTIAPQVNPDDKLDGGLVVITVVKKR